MKTFNKNIQELLYAQHLADVDVSVRTKALKKLRKYLKFKSSKEGFTLDDLIKIWKGLYYCMYMADKPLVQENLAESIGNLIHDMNNDSQKLLFFKSCLQTFSREWNGIDNFRMDKFMMLFTRVLRQCFIHLSENNWEQNEINSYMKLFEIIILCPSDDTNSKPLGLKMHLIDIILEELAKIGKENLKNDVIITFLYPFFRVLVVSRQQKLINYVQSRIFNTLIRQSDLGIEHQDDLIMGEMEIVKSEEEILASDEVNEDGGEEPLDPRAGGVDVYIPQLRPDYKQIADIFMALGSIPEITQKKRKMMYEMCTQFLDLEMGVYPFKDPELTVEPSLEVPRKKIIENATHDLEKFEEALKSENSKSLKLGQYGNSIKKRNPWKPLKKKSKEEKKKEAKKGMINLDRVMNKTMMDMSEKLKLPKGVCSSNQHEIKRKKNDAAFIVKENVVNKDALSNGENNINVVSEKEEIVNKKKRKNKKKKGINEVKRMKLSTTGESCDTVESVQNNDRLVNFNSGNDRLVNFNSGETFKKEVNQCVVSEGKKKRKRPKKKLLAKTIDIPEKTDINFPKINTERIEKQNSADSEVPKLFKNNSWDEPLKKGEKEFFIENPKFMKKLKKKGKLEKISPKLDMVIKKTPQINTRGKVLKINLRENKEHDLNDYKRIVNASPALPYSAHKKPKSSALKGSPSPASIKKLKKKKIPYVKSLVNFD